MRQPLALLAALIITAAPALAEKAPAKPEGKLAVAALHFRSLTDMDPYDLGGQRRLIELCLREGRRSEAQRRYAALRVKMMREFGEALDFDFTDLLQPGAQLRMG